MDFKDLTARRCSVRKYTDRKVGDEDIEYIKECARMAPSACNLQPWKFLIVSSDEAKARIRQCYNRPWFASASLYVLALKNVSESWVRQADGKNHGDIDLAIAVEHMVLAAAERGLGTCWVCNFDVEAVARLFPAEGFEAVAILPIGHVDDSLPQAEKIRKSAAEIFEEV